MVDYHDKFIDRWALIFLRKGYHETMIEAMEWAERTVPDEALELVQDRMRYIKKHQRHRIESKDGV